MTSSTSWPPRRSLLLARRTMPHCIPIVATLPSPNTSGWSPSSPACPQRPPVCPGRYRPPPPPGRDRQAPCLSDPVRVNPRVRPPPEDSPWPSASTMRVPDRQHPSFSAPRPARRGIVLLYAATPQEAEDYRSAASAAGPTHAACTSPSGKKPSRPSCSTKTIVATSAFRHGHRPARSVRRASLHPPLP